MAGTADRPAGAEGLVESVQQPGFGGRVHPVWGSGPLGLQPSFPPPGSTSPRGLCTLREPCKRGQRREGAVLGDLLYPHDRGTVDLLGAPPPGDGDLLTHRLRPDRISPSTGSAPASGAASRPPVPVPVTLLRAHTKAGKDATRYDGIEMWSARGLPGRRGHGTARPPSPLARNSERNVLRWPRQNLRTIPQVVLDRPCRAAQQALDVVSHRIELAGTDLPIRAHPCVDLPRRGAELGRATRTASSKVSSR